MGTDGLFTSMFHRRLALLMVVCVAPVGLVLAQLVRLTVVQGAELRNEAESKLVIHQWQPTTRGRILDRNGRILAQDRPSFDIAVDYAVISGEWAETQGAQAARRAHADRWDELAPEQRADLIDRYKAIFDQHVQQAWTRLARETGIDRHRLLEQAQLAEIRVESMVQDVFQKRRSQEIAALVARGREITTQAEHEIEESLRKQRLLEQEVPHPILRGIDDQLAFRLMRLTDITTTLELPVIDGGRPIDVSVPPIPGLAVATSSTREYPFASTVVDVDMSSMPPPLASDGHQSMQVDGVATHILGWMGPRATDEDIKRRQERLDSEPTFAARVRTTDGVDRGRYRPGDPAPRAGVEWSREQDLRGLRGLRVVNLETNTDARLDPVPGADVNLTIDVMLQARIQAIMDPKLGLARVQEWHGETSPDMPVGTPIYGSAVVIEVETGEILAMVSTPSFTREQLENDPDSIFKDPIGTPWVNKAIAKPYPPGSIAKAIVLSEAATMGKLGIDERIPCTGHFLPNRDDILRCWIYRDRYGYTTHSARLDRDPDLVDALMVSCNIFAYAVGHRLGPDGITKVYRDYGVGVPFDLGVGQQYEGIIGQAGDGSDLTLIDATMMGMGQGPVAWTPVHAANAFATLANGGIWIQPSVIRDNRAPVVRDLQLDPRAVGAALQGLYNVVNDRRNGTGHAIHYPDPYGSANIFNAPGVDVWGKTGTAQASPIVADPDGDGPEPTKVLRTNDHSWFTALVAPEGERPRYAVCVLMEHAGSGGRVSGPIANQIVHALIDEGYLEP